ncbi:uncharacterized protein LOC121367645 [Gigantopelta aegis]|uniref:uncharacterized protein LOC121367645 n=1 Tax=Gigantopelta aegis TaxID=1735272 RepID=UPI001B88C3BB|nr:uncharacterized protein LOC121367645 [Gigantopelta aegis]XP_041347882.1 uncharacterized protein LOC121367645 [Gigantopelta aegis]
MPPTHLAFLLCLLTPSIGMGGYDVTSQYGHLCRRGVVYVSLPWDCSGFIQCTGASDGAFTATWMPCSWQLQYDNQQHVCVFGPGSCTNMTRVAIESCQLNPNLKFAHPDNCALYYDCKQTTALAGLDMYQNECPYPELFDQRKQTCQPASQVECNKRRAPLNKCDYKLACDPSICVGKAAGLHPVPGEEFGTEYIMCIAEKFMSQDSCNGADELFDPIKRTCTNQYQESVASFCQSNPSAVFGDKTTCSLYYDCRKADHHITTKPYQTECPYPMLYDWQKKKCMPYEKVQCGARPEPKKPCDYQVGHCSGRDQCIPCPGGVRTS